MTENPTPYRTVTVEVTRQSQVEPTEKTLHVAAMFGLGIDTNRPVTTIPKPPSLCPKVPYYCSPDHRAEGNHHYSGPSPKTYGTRSTNSDGTPPTFQTRRARSSKPSTPTYKTPSNASEPSASATPGPCSEHPNNFPTDNATDSPSPESGITPTNSKNPA